LANNVATTAAGVVGLTWASGPYNGGSPVIDYTISYKSGTNAYSVLV